MVFAESMPAATRLADKNTPADERKRIISDVKDTIDITKSIADRNSQVGRHEANHARRDRVMADYVPGKRGEPKRLASLHGVSRRTVEKWIDQLRAAAPAGSAAVPDDWRTVYVGQRLRQQNSVAGKKRRARKG
jgi:transposase-like protein